jgi:hypothetical protein
MTSMESASKIEKCDRRGHMRRSPSRRGELLAEFDQSGLSGPQFCALTGVNYQTLMGWLQRRKVQQRKNSHSSAAPKALPPAAETPVWIEATVEKAPSFSSSASKSGIIIRLPSGVEMNVSSPEQASLAAAVVRSWEKPAC